MKKIYINPGHSDKDPGAVGYETERVLNVKVSNFMNEYLVENYVCETRMNPGSMDKLSEICADANAWGADLFVSNHFNAAGGDGYEALVYSEQRIPLGKIFEKFILAIGQNSRGVKIRKNLSVLKNTNMPAILNEGAFVDNLKDIQDWNEDHELKKMGEAYAKAAAEHLGLAKREKKSVNEVAQEVINGKWGNGEERKKKLTEAGYDYNEVQAEVNRILTGKKTVHEIALEVIQGKWGVGQKRKKRLMAEGYDYFAVQAEVNRLLK